MVSVTVFKGHRQTLSDATEDCVVCGKQAGLLTFSPAVVRHQFAAVTEFAAAAETAKGIRRSLLPLIFPPEQSATRRSSRRSVDRSVRDHRRRRGRDGNRSIFHEPRSAAFRKKYRAFLSRYLA